MARQRRSLAFRITAWTVGLLTLVAGIAGAAVWGLQEMSLDLDRALQGYRVLRTVYEAGVDIAGARESLLTSHGSPEGAAVVSERLRFAAGRIATMHQPDENPYAPVSERERRLAQVVTARLGEVARGRPTLQGVNSVLGELASLGALARDRVEHAQAKAAAHRRATMVWVAGLVATLVLGAIAMVVMVYRAVVTPLSELRRGVRDATGARFRNELQESGDREFAELAADFNRMAHELDGLYTDLEAKVAAQSRELARSERLASVGYLAAGVAHEINNPLGVIAGHAELSLRKLRRATMAAQQISASGTSLSPATLSDTMRSFEVICEEAFRCKRITEKLLALSRAGGTLEARRVGVPLGKAVRDVAELAAALVGEGQRLAGRQIEVAGWTRGEGEDGPGGEQGDEVIVFSESSELRQVLLNLVVNALEAVDAGPGVVRLEWGILARSLAGAGLVKRGVVWVTDNGKGMAPEVLEQVFEPFFTQKRGVSGAGPESGKGEGTGLGLSISHAIIERHGGRILAESQGEGRGSRFIVELPLWSQDAATAGSVAREARA